MKKLVFALVLFAFGLIVKGQSVSVEKSTFGIQAGFLGIWVHYEARLSNQFALRSEIGLNTGTYGSDNYDLEGPYDGYFLAPEITLEPRWYYNLIKRESKSKLTDGNSANFISLKVTYHPDWFVIFNEDDFVFISDILIVPTWGIRRNISNHFNYEAGFGIGYGHRFEKENTTLEDLNVVAVNLHLRIGYRF